MGLREFGSCLKDEIWVSCHLWLWSSLNSYPTDMKRITWAILCSIAIQVGIPLVEGKLGKGRRGVGHSMPFFLGLRGFAA